MSILFYQTEDHNVPQIKILKDESVKERRFSDDLIFSAQPRFSRTDLNAEKDRTFSRVRFPIWIYNVTHLMLIMLANIRGSLDVFVSL